MVGRLELNGKFVWSYSYQLLSFLDYIIHPFQPKSASIRQPFRLKKHPIAYYIFCIVYTNSEFASMSTMGDFGGPL